MKIKISHFLGGIFLVSGTTIGVGMLGTPVLTGFSGLFPSLLLFAAIWVIMLASAFFFLDVNLAVRGEPNMISMAQKTLGKWGKALSWVFYLLLLYSLLAAYISASAPLFSGLFAKLTNHPLPSWISPFFLPLIFGGFVYLGTLGVDIVNRFLMTGLLVSYFLLIGSSPEHIETSLLKHVDFKALPVAITVITTSFGYHIIIPTLTTYMKHDRRHLAFTILWGSLLSFLAYAVWQVVALGIVPITGSNGILAAYQGGASVTSSLAKIVQSRYLATFAQFFSFFAITTSFLGVSLSLSDFLRDGFKIKKSWEGRLLATALTFVPPLIFVFSYPKGFLMALEFAGAFVAILLIFLPAAMAWTLKKPHFYRTFWGRTLLLIVITIAFGIVLVDILEQRGYLKPLIRSYVQA